MMRIESGERLDDFVHHFRTMSALVFNKIVAAHARLARQSGGDDHDIGIFGAVVAIQPRQLHIKAFDRRGLGQIERLALRHAFDNVDQQTSPSSFAASQ